MRTMFRSLARPVLLATLVLLPAALSGCVGFTPLYSQSVTGNMSQVALDVPQTRTGHFLEQDLRNGIGGDENSPKLYQLVITMSERHYSIGYRVDDTSTRSEITSKVTYKLLDLATGRKLVSKDFSETVTYDTSSSPFTGIVSQRDAQERIATAISDLIQTDLAVYFRAK